MRVRSNHESKVRRFVEARDVEAFLPTWSETVRWSDREKITVRPLFPGYVFAHCDRAELLDLVRLPGVVNVLPSSMEPIEIPDSQITDLKTVVASALPVAPCAYVAGETVTVDSGPLAGVSGVVVRTKGSARLVVRVPMLAGAVNVELDAATVKKENGNQQNQD